MAVLDVRSRGIVDPGRPTKPNLVEVGFTTFVDGDEVVTDLERAFTGSRSAPADRSRSP